MSENSAVQIARSFYENKNYLSAAQASLELIKNEETAKHGHLLFTTAFMFLISGATDTDKLETLYTSAGTTASCVTSWEEYCATEREILDAQSQWTREKIKIALGNLEKNPTLDLWNVFFRLYPEFYQIHIMLSISMRNQPNVVSLKKDAGDLADEIRKKYPQTNDFTREEYHELVFDSACRIYQNALIFAKNECRGPSHVVQSTVVTALNRFFTTTSMVTYTLPEEGKGQDHVRLVRQQKHAEMIQSFLNTRMYPNGREMWIIQGDSRDTWNSKLTEINKDIQYTKGRIEHTRQEEAKRRIAVYWEAHADEKKQLEDEQAQIQKRLKELDSPIKTAANTILNLQNKKTAKLPIENACDEQENTIASLKYERSKCGIFKGKRKKEITEQLDTIEIPHYEELMLQAKEGRQAYINEIDMQISELNEQVRPQKEEQEQLRKREAEIKQELTKDR